MEPERRGEAATEDAVGGARGWLVAGAATLVMSVSYVDRQALAAVATKVRGELDISHAQYGALGSAFAAAYLVGAPLSGWLLDRLGARRGLVLAVAVWSAVAALHAAAISFATLLLLRVLLGLAEAPSFPGAMQAVRRSLSPARRSAGVGLLFTGSSLGSMVAAPLALYLASRYDWRAAFALIAMAGLAWIPVWLAATTRLRDDRGTRAANERSGASSSADERHLLARGPMWRAMLAVVTSAPAIMLVLTWFPQYLAESRHATSGEMARTLWIPPLAFDVGAVAFGALASALRGADARPPRALLVVAALLASTLALVPSASDVWSAVALASVSMAGGAGVYVLSMSELLSQVSPSETSRASGLSAAAQSLAHIVANPLVGLAVDRTHSFTAVMVVLGLVVLPGAAAWTFFPEQHPPSTPP